jgi:perosamine synthetase
MARNKVPWSQPDIGPAEARAIRKVIDSGWLSMGPTVKEFESRLTTYLGARNVVMVNNGTSALLAIYLASGVAPGDEVLVPSYTFIATVNTLLAIGAVPILVDADPNTFNVSPALLGKVAKAHPRAKHAVIVDVAGMPCDLDEIDEICGANGLMLIEDAAEAIGAEYKNKRIGDGAHPTIFSFHAAKLMTSIEGGAVVSNDDGVAEKVRLIRSHGEDPRRKYWHTAVGLNLRPLEFQGALALIQLGKLERYIKNRNSIAEYYSEELRGLLTPQRVPSFVTRHPYMLYMGLLRDKRTRDQLCNHLKESGIDYRIPWPPAHRQEFGHGLGQSGYPSADGIFGRVISLPIFNAMTRAEARKVVQASKSFFNRR